ncbi:macro domain-containing protein [Paenibacillus dendrobii]|uniref:macro domain-containing protein n=1 Tax=Paenibacillus dendrobii TaxID=2691084 RepID=UPI001922D0F6
MFFDINPEICREFEAHFGELPNVRIENKRLVELDGYECIVSPANSYGMMDGGLDKHIIEMFGVELMDTVQKYIIDNFAGEQPVGTSFVIPTNNKSHPYLAHTPTMRFPRSIVGTDNVYQSMKAMLIAINKFNQSQHRIDTVACSGLGTTTGRMNPLIAVKQMRLAYDHVLNVPKYIDWNFVNSRVDEIATLLK